jgi:WD40 repeat protein
MAYIWLVAVLPNDKFATALMTDEIFVWDLGPPSGFPLDNYRVLDEDLHDMTAWSDMLVTATQSKVRTWDTSTGECLSILIHDAIDLLTVSDDLLILGTFDGAITVLDGCGHLLTTHSYGSTIVRLFGLPDRLLAICNGSQVLLYRIEASGLSQIWHAAGYYHMTHHVRGIIASYMQGIVRVWYNNITVELPCKATAVCVLHGSRVAVACSDHAIGVYDLSTRAYTPLSSVGVGLTPKLLVNKLMQLPDGRLAGYTDRCIAVWDLHTLEHVIWPRPCYPVTTFKIVGSMLLICYDHVQNALHVLQ